MQKSDCIIGVEHVSKFFGDKAVLNDVNLSVRKGEFVTILGPSGCGKTTLLRLIAGFQTASEGVITIAGKDIIQHGLVSEEFRYMFHTDDAIGLLHKRLLLYPNELNEFRAFKKASAKLHNLSGIFALL